jgi:hypothetical protein
MIEGLKFLMTSEELRTLLQQRIDHHSERRGFYERQHAALKAGAGGENLGMQGHSGVNPLDGLAAKAREHANKIRLFSFMREHVIPDESDLGRIEILDRFI